LNIEALLQVVLKNHPDYLQALLVEKEAQTNLLLANNNQLWKLDLEARYNITGSSTYDLETQEDSYISPGNYSVGMSLKIPFGDYTLQREALNARVEYRKAKIELQELKEDIEISLQDADRNIKMKWKEVELSRKVRELSQKQLDIELEKFKANRSNNFQILSFQNYLIQAERNENATKVAYLDALTDLDLLLGTTLEHWGIRLESARKVELL